MKKRNYLINMCVSLIAILSVVLSLVACDNSGKLKYSINADNTTCTITGIRNFRGEDLIIPEEIDGYKVVAIADNAFMNYDFKTVSLPDTITQIGKSAFESCSLLESINIPQQVVEIQERTFYECTNLKTIKFPEGLTDIRNFAFWYCEKLESIEFPSTLINIGQGAFFYCNLLTEIDLPEGLKKIDGFGFGYCHSLTEVYIPASVETLNIPFASCYCLKNINVDADNKYYISVDGVLYDKTLDVLYQYPGGKTETEFTIPASVTYIQAWAFSLNHNLRSIDIPGSVKLMNTQIVMDCPNLNTINYNGTILRWNAIKKHEKWDTYWQNYDLNYTIYCTDGQIAKDGTVTYN